MNDSHNNIFSKEVYHVLKFNFCACIIFVFLVSFIKFDFYCYVFNIFYPGELSAFSLVLFAFFTFMFMFGILFMSCYALIYFVLFPFYCSIIAAYIFYCVLYFLYSICFYVISCFCMYELDYFWFFYIIVSFLIKPIICLITIIILFRTILYSFNMLERFEIIWLSSSMSHRVLFVSWITLFLFPIIEYLYFF